MANITNLNLTHVSATCSVYTNTDYLLVHDDQREDRLVAFIFYLTNSGPWTEDKGGALQLFNKDHNLHPHGVVKNIFPLNNQFIFFPVTNDSYHQVCECVHKKIMTYLIFLQKLYCQAIIKFLKFYTFKMYGYHKYILDNFL